jgi:hypothetical protein
VDVSNFQIFRLHLKAGQRLPKMTMRWNFMAFKGAIRKGKFYWEPDFKQYGINWDKEVTVKNKKPAAATSGKKPAAAATSKKTATAATSKKPAATSKKALKEPTAANKK